MGNVSPPVFPSNSGASSQYDNYHHLWMNVDINSYLTETEEDCLQPAQKHLLSPNCTKNKYFKATLMNTFTKEKLFSAVSIFNISLFPCFLSPSFTCCQYLEVWLLIQEGCVRVCAFPTCVCIPLWPPLICQGVLVRVAVSSINICASAQRLNIHRRAKSNGERKKQQVFVCVSVFGL